MSSDDKTDYPTDPEKDNNVDECKSQDEVFRGYSIPEAAGVIIDFKIMESVFVSQDTLKQVLSGQDQVIIIPYGERSGAANVVYFASTTDPSDRSRGYDYKKMHQQSFAITSLEGDSAGCECLAAQILDKSPYWDCRPGNPGQCKCTHAITGKIITINNCG